MKAVCGQDAEDSFSPHFLIRLGPSVPERPPLPAACPRPRRLVRQFAGAGAGVTDARRRNRNLASATPANVRMSTRGECEVRSLAGIMTTTVSSPSIQDEAINGTNRAPLADAETDISINDADVAVIQNGIREAAAEEPVNLGESSLYYDAVTMSPLNPFSAVSQVLIYFVANFLPKFRADQPPTLRTLPRITLSQHPLAMAMTRSLGFTTLMPIHSSHAQPVQPRRMLTQTR